VGALSEHFRSEGPGRESEWARQRRWFIKAKHDHQRREEIADKIEDGVAALATEVVMATQTQIQTFEVKLDSYDAATVAALMENQELIDAVTDRIADMLTRAYVMQDGRRVFKTEDGTQVFDEFGVEVPPDELDPDLIDDNRPTYEAYAADVESLALLESDRTQILEFQQQVDAAREQIADGELSEADLEGLDADLLDAMPPAIRGQVPGLEPTTPQQHSIPEVADKSTAPTMRTQSIETTGPAPLPFQ
jgi:hypothetical protein